MKRIFFLLVAVIIIFLFTATLPPATILAESSIIDPFTTLDNEIYDLEFNSKGKAFVMEQFSVGYTSEQTNFYSINKTGKKKLIKRIIVEDNEEIAPFFEITQKGKLVYFIHTKQGIQINSFPIAKPTVKPVVLATLPKSIEGDIEMVNKDNNGRIYVYATNVDGKENALVLLNKSGALVRIIELDSDTIDVDIDSAGNVTVLTSRWDSTTKKIESTLSVLSRNENYSESSTYTLPGELSPWKAFVTDQYMYIALIKIVDMQGEDEYQYSLQRISRRDGSISDISTQGIVDDITEEGGKTIIMTLQINDDNDVLTRSFIDVTNIDSLVPLYSTDGRGRGIEFNNSILYFINRDSGRLTDSIIDNSIGIIK